MSVRGCAATAASVAVDVGKDPTGYSGHGRRSLVIGTLGVLMLLAGCTKVGPDFVPDATKDTMAERTNWGDLLTPAEEETLIPPTTTPDDSYRWPDW